MDVSPMMDSMHKFLDTMLPVTLIAASLGFALALAPRVAAFFLMFFGAATPAQKQKNDEKPKNAKRDVFEWNNELLEVVDAPESEPPR
jgi:hypothetical protein